MRDIFPGIVNEQAEALLAHLPPPPAIVLQQFNHALSTPRVRWEEAPDRGELEGKFLSGAAFDSEVVIVPRLSRKRVFDFPRRSPATINSTFRTAFIRRYRSEA